MKKVVFPVDIFFFLCVYRSKQTWAEQNSLLFLNADALRRVENKLQDGHVGLDTKLERVLTRSKVAYSA